MAKFDRFKRGHTGSMMGQHAKYSNQLKLMTCCFMCVFSRLEEENALTHRKICRVEMAKSALLNRSRK
jgi:hypothetical protein